MCNSEWANFSAAIGDRTTDSVFYRSLPDNMQYGRRRPSCSLVALGENVAYDAGCWGVTDLAIQQHLRDAATVALRQNLRCDVAQCLTVF